MPYLTARRSLIAYNGYDVGLGNRLRVTLGAKSLAAAEQRAFYYVWPTGERFGPRMSELWDFRAPTVSRATSRLLARRWPYVDESLDWLTDAKRRERIWQLRTGSELALRPGMRPWDEELRALRPVAQLADSVAAQFDAHLSGAPYVGVMIRAHQVSHARTREASPVEWFLTRMHAIREEIPDVRFFVSSDVAEVAQRVIAEVPGCWTQPDKGGYNTTAGVRAAVVDLYLLAGAGYLLGPHFSSFVEMAVYLSGRRLVLETSAGRGAAGRDMRHVADPGRGDPVPGRPATSTAPASAGIAADLAAAGRITDPLQPACRTP